MVKEIQEISPEEARIHANICGDGSMYIIVGKRGPADLKTHPRKNIYRNIYWVKYSNNEINLLTRFSIDVKIVYGLKTYLYDYEQSIRAKWVFDRLKKLGAGGSHEWFISGEILAAKKPIISEWLKAFFDDEGHVDIEESYITLNSVNLKGLKQVQYLLNKLGIIEISIKGPYYYKGFFSYRLKILSKGLIKFKELVGFSHPKKVRELNELIAGRNRKQLARASSIL